jgi:hypothetical protein
MCGLEKPLQQSNDTVEYRQSRMQMDYQEKDQQKLLIKRKINVIFSRDLNGFKMDLIIWSTFFVIVSDLFL